MKWVRFVVRDGPDVPGWETVEEAFAGFGRMQEVEVWCRPESVSLRGAPGWPVMTLLVDGTALGLVLRSELAELERLLGAEG